MKSNKSLFSSKTYLLSGNSYFIEIGLNLLIST